MKLIYWFILIFLKIILQWIKVIAVIFSLVFKKIRIIRITVDLWLALLSESRNKSFTNKIKMYFEITQNKVLRLETDVFRKRKH